mmetsp:Transcript_25690/g.41952  ORF Transcript_25690/g.41952 Transcript_25690/m.41952 type:complete len:427 (-) Transcript_25690:52-1332(-)
MSFQWRINFNSRFRYFCLQFSHQSTSKILHIGRTSAEHHRFIQIFAQVQVTLVNAVVNAILNTAVFSADNGRIEEHFWRNKACTANVQFSAVGEHIFGRSHRSGTRHGRDTSATSAIHIQVLLNVLIKHAVVAHCLGVVLVAEFRLLAVRAIARHTATANAAHASAGATSTNLQLTLLLFDLAHNLLLAGRVVEFGAALAQQILEVVGHFFAANVDALNGVWNGEALTDWHYRRQAVPAVHHASRHATTRVQRQHRWWRKIQRRHIELLEEDLGRLHAIADRIMHRFRQQHWMVLCRRIDVRLVHILPQARHIFEIVRATHHAILHRIHEATQSAVLHLLIAEKITLLAVCLQHDAAMFRYTNARWNHRRWPLVTAHACLDTATAIVDHNGRVEIVQHAVIVHDLCTLKALDHACFRYLAPCSVRC